MAAGADAPRPQDFRLLYPLRVRWRDLDPQGIVFNPHYLAYADIGIDEYLRAIGLPYPEGLAELGTDIFAVNANVDFHASAVYDDRLELGVRVERFGRTSLAFRVAMFRGEQLLVNVGLTYVNADTRSRRPMPLPDRLVAAVEAFEGEPVPQSPATPAG